MVCCEPSQTNQGCIVYLGAMAYICVMGYFLLNYSQTRL